MEPQKNSQSHPAGKKEQRHQLPDFKLLQSMLVKAAWYGHKHTHTAQWNRTESPNEILAYTVI